MNSPIELNVHALHEIDLQKIYTENRGRLLVCDNDDLDRERLRRLLTKLSLQFEVLECDSGMQVLTLLETTSVDCMLLDYQLGDMTGLELLQEISRKFQMRVPSIIVTGFGSETIAVQVLHAGAYDYISKHAVDVKTLGDTLEATLKRSILEKQLASFQEKIRRMSLQDELTSLPNRYKFFSFLDHTLAEAIRDKASFSVMMIDLNLFKQINDTMGHGAGDIVLRVIGERLANLIQGPDLVARIGGDEFAVVALDATMPQAIESLCERVSQTISNPIFFNDTVALISCSIGVSIYPKHGRDANSLLSNADYAMYMAKHTLANFVVFDGDFSVQNYSNVNIARDLPEAMKHNHLYLEYQPKVNLGNNVLYGVEALLRWKNGVGLISPQYFIPTIERTQLIGSLTEFSVLQALQQYNVWREQGMLIPIAVNISAKMLDNQSFAQWIIQAVQRFNIEAANITLEITETALASTTETAKQVINQWLEFGFKVSIDDFGSGFTSFRYIRDINISEIKIDQSYIQNLDKSPRARSIVKSIGLMADELSIQVVAEGVEYQANCEILNELGCFKGQGYYVARPMRGEKLSGWVQQRALVTARSL